MNGPMCKEASKKVWSFWEQTRLITMRSQPLLRKQRGGTNYWRFCQNPNLTTIQPNLNLVRFDTIITLHPPLPTHHHHRNSNSTRNNDPRGLIFCRRPHQPKLTTTQPNFNPKKFFDPKIFFGPIIFFNPNSFLNKRILFLTNFWTTLSNTKKN